MAESKYNPSLEPLVWLFGKWHGDSGRGIYPTIESFNYGEEVEFHPVGMQPTVEYKMSSWNAATKAPMHRESGYIKIKPGSQQVALVSSHNFGLVDLQEGEVKGQELSVATESISRCSFSKDPQVKKTQRTFQRVGDSLEHVLSMETVNTAMTEHLRITYRKVTC